MPLDEKDREKEKTKRILENFDFNKLFYPTYGQPKTKSKSQQRPAKKVPSPRERKEHNRNKTVTVYER